MFGDERFAAVLRELVDGQPFAMSPGLLAKLSQTPKATVVNWLDERVRRPRRWQDVVRVADALRADVASTDRLLTAAGHDDLARLLQAAGPDERRLLETWRLGIPYHDCAAPVPAGTFVGRHDDTRALSTLLTRGGRGVVNLVGPAGVGKTRLAIEMAHRLRSSFRNGVVYISFVGDADEIAVRRHIADAFLVGDGDVHGAVHRLRGTSTLVVLDGVEHVAETVAPIAATLASIGAGVSVLTTSRSVLALAGERIHRLGPLDVPNGVDLDDLEPLDDGAVALFVDRARGVRPGFAPSRRSLPAIIEICRQLDGLPLSVEIAAARMSIMSPNSLLRRLDHSASTPKAGRWNAAAPSLTARCDRQESSTARTVAATDTGGRGRIPGWRRARSLRGGRASDRRGS